MLGIVTVHRRSLGEGLNGFGGIGLGHTVSANGIRQNAGTVADTVVGVTLAEMPSMTAW